MDKQREEFEKWLEETYGLYGEDVEWQESRNCYAKFGIHLAFNAWQAASNSPEIPDGWVSCKERMPEMGCEQCYVLAADFRNHYWPNMPNTQVGVFGDWFNDGNPTWDDGDGNDLYLKEVTHWMPLPAPPKQDK